MSKSYGNTIEIFGEEKVLRKKIMGNRDGFAHARRAEAGRGQEPRDPVVKFFAAPEVALDYENRLRAGGLGYGRFEEGAVRALLELFSAVARTRRAELAANMDHVDAVLRDGAERARAVADRVIGRARKACGLR